MATKHKKAAKNKPRSVWQSAPIALAVTVGLSLLLLLLLSRILLSTKDPVRYTNVTGPVILYLVTAFGGFLATLFCGRRFALLSGLLIGVGMLVFCTVCALFMKNEGSMLAGFLFRLPLLVAAIGGALIAARQKRKPRRKRR